MTAPLTAHDTWKVSHHTYERPEDRSGMTETERFACVACGNPSQHVWHQFRPPLAEAWAEQQSGNFRVFYGSLADVVGWLEERTHEADRMAEHGTQKERRYNRGRADAFRQAAMAILEIQTETGLLHAVRIGDARDEM